MNPGICRTSGRRPHETPSGTRLDRRRCGAGRSLRLHRQRKQPESSIAAVNFATWISIPVERERADQRAPATRSNGCDSSDFGDAADQPQWRRFYDVRPAVGRGGTHEDDHSSFLRRLRPGPAHRRQPQFDHGGGGLHALRGVLRWPVHDHCGAYFDHAHPQSGEPLADRHLPHSVVDVTRARALPRGGGSRP